MDGSALTRRTLIERGAALTTGGVARALWPMVLTASASACAANGAGSSYAVLTDSEAAELEAIASRIFPATDTPGAREAGVVYYFDTTFATFHAGDLELARAGLADLAGRTPGGVAFSTLSESEQDEVLREIENTGFFQLVRYMTICGVFGMASYGGNKDAVGYTLLGMTPHVHAFVPPFGYYDAEAMGVPYDG